MNIIKNVLSNRSLFRRGGTAELIEVTIEPLVDLSVDCIVIVTNLLAGFLLLQSFGLSSGTVFISAANVDAVVAGEASVPGVDIGGENAADDVAQVRNVVNVWKRRGNQNVALALLGDDWLTRGDASDLGVRAGDADAFASLLA